MGAGETIRELLVSIGIEADEGQLANMDKAIGQIKDGLSNLADVATKAALAVSAFAAAAVYQAVSTADAAGDIRDQADALGLTTDAYQELLYAVQHVGGEASDLSAMLAKLSIAGQNAVEGNEALADTFGKLGISLDEVKGSNPADLLAQLADGLAATTDPAERLAIATALLGDDIAKKMIPLLGKGSEEIEALAKQAKELGVVMGEDDLEAADAFSDQVGELGAILSALRNEIGLALIPALAEIATAFLEWYKANKSVIDQKIEFYADKVAGAFTAVADAVAAANDIVGGVDGWLKLGAILGSLTAAGGLLYVAFQVGMVVFAIVDLVAAAAAFVGGGWVLVGIVAAIIAGLAQLAAYAAAVAAVFLVVEDFYTYLQGGDSVWGRLIERWRSAPGFLGAIARAMEAMGAVGRAVLELLSIYVDNFVAGLQPAIQWTQALGAAILDYVGKALDYVAPLLDMLTGKLTELAGALGSDQAKAGVATAGQLSGAGAGFASNPLYAASATAGAAQSAAAGFAPTSGSPYAGAAGGAKTVGGDTITISGVGITMEEAEELIARKAAEKSRLTAATFQSAEV